MTSNKQASAQALDDASSQYADIIRLPHHTSASHKPMPLEARAAQFAPFAALTGYEQALAATLAFHNRSQNAGSAIDEGQAPSQ